MYKKNQHRQFRFTDFNQPVGLKMDPENRWVKKAAMIPWDAIEEKYAELFPSDTGNPAKPVRMALGALLIQKLLMPTMKAMFSLTRWNGTTTVQAIIRNGFL